MIDFYMYYAVGKSIKFKNGHCSLKKDLTKYFDVDSDLNDNARKQNTSGTAQGQDSEWKSVLPILSSPYFSPLLCDDLSSLPTAHVLSCEQDVLRDEAILYASRLQQAGVQATRKHYQCLHALLDTAYLDYGQVMMKDIVEYLKKNL